MRCGYVFTYFFEIIRITNEKIILVGVVYFSMFFCIGTSFLIWVFIGTLVWNFGLDLFCNWNFELDLFQFELSVGTFFGSFFAK